MVKREFVLTPEADATLDRLVELYRRATRTRLSTSHVIRSILLATGQGMDALLSELSLMQPMRLPSNAPGRDAERTRFESALAHAFRNAMRCSALLDRLDDAKSPALQASTPVE